LKLFCHSSFDKALLLSLFVFVPMNGLHVLGLHVLGLHVLGLHVYTCSNFAPRQQHSTNAPEAWGCAWQGFFLFFLNLLLSIPGMFF